MWRWAEERGHYEARWPTKALPPHPGESGGSAGSPGWVTSSDVSFTSALRPTSGCVVTCSLLTSHVCFGKIPQRLGIFLHLRRRTLHSLFSSNRACFSSSANRITETCGKATAQKMPSHGKERKYLPGQPESRQTEAKYDVRQAVAANRVSLLPLAEGGGGAQVGGAAARLNPLSFSG